MVLQELVVSHQDTLYSQPHSPHQAYSGTLGRVKDEKSQLGITAICFFDTILYGESEFTALLMFSID